MPISFLGKTISGPFTIPSGIITTDVSTIERVAHTIPQIGILTTKSISINPKVGNREPIYTRYSQSPNSFMNAVGLTNPGAEEFAKRLQTISLPKNRFLLISVFGATAEDFYHAGRILMPFADGFELNISCPHAKGYGQSIGQDLPMVEAIIRKMKTLGKPVLVKVSPNIPIEETARACITSGIDGFVAINTWGPKPQEYDGHPILTNVVGGVSGQVIRDIGIAAVKKIRSMTDLPIVACGGIADSNDVRMYKKAGADVYGIGSCLTGMDTKELKMFFQDLSYDIIHHSDTVSTHLRERENFSYHKSTISAVDRIDDTHFVLTITGDITVKPGQFIFLWIPGIGEKPFSVLDTNPTKIWMKAKGCFTKAVLEKKKGDSVYWRGPYGKTIRLKGRTLLVGAGTGIAALYLFAKSNPDTYALLGVKTQKQAVYEDQFRSHCKRVWITTSQEGGKAKKHVTDILQKVIQEIKPTCILNCGPEHMVYDVLTIEKKFLSETHIYSSIEFVTKCGVGICGSCATGTGLRSCVDGTFFTPDEIRKKGVV